MKSFLVIVIPLAVVAFWVLFVIVAIRVAEAAAIRRELKMSKSGASPSSNSRRFFRMSVTSVRKRGRGRIITGTLLGPQPERGQVVYLVSEGDRVPVYLRKVRLLDMPDAQKGINVEITTAETIRLNGEPVEVTNLRVREARTESAGTEASGAKKTEASGTTGAGKAETSEAAAAGKAETSGTAAAGKAGVQEPAQDDFLDDGSSLLAGLCWPVTVRRALRSVWVPVAVIGIGALDLAFCVVGLIRSSAGIGMTVFMLCISLLFIAAGVWLLLENVITRIVFSDETSVEIRTPGKRIRCHIDNLHAHIYLKTNGSERWVLEVRNVSGKVLCAFDDRDRNYQSAEKLFRRAALKKRFVSRRDFLLESQFHVPLRFVVTDAEQSQKLAPVVLTNTENGARVVFCYTSEELLRSHFFREFDATTPVTLDYLKELSMDFTTIQEIRVMAGSVGEEPDEIVIDRTAWERLHRSDKRE